jgi:hypothetical protein
VINFTGSCERKENLPSLSFGSIVHLGNLVDVRENQEGASLSGIPEKRRVHLPLYWKRSIPEFGRSFVDITKNKEIWQLIGA